MSDMSNMPIRELIILLRKEPEDNSNPMRTFLMTLVLSTLATRLEEQANEIENRTAKFKHHEWHWQQAFEECGYDSSAMMAAECIYGDNCPGWDDEKMQTM